MLSVLLVCLTIKLAGTHGWVNVRMGALYGNLYVHLADKPKHARLRSMSQLVRNLFSWCQQVLLSDTGLTGLVLRYVHYQKKVMSRTATDQR